PLYLEKRDLRTRPARLRSEGSIADSMNPDLAWVGRRYESMSRDEGRHAEERALIVSQLERIALAMSAGDGSSDSKYQRRIRKIIRDAL
ncbi:MAG: hypothetical protein EBX52_13240, partial [Proteobacteria bacterium]|nr:hypothetical protein [Pseudomonadota bacterium]